MYWWDWLMSRKVLTTKYGGEVVLKNVGAEYVRKIKAVLSEDEAPQPVDALPQVEENEPETDDPSKLPCVAVSTYRDATNNWYVALLRFDPANDMAVVVEKRKVGNNKIFAVEAFKIASADNDLI